MFTFKMTSFVDISICKNRRARKINHAVETKTDDGSHELVYKLNNQPIKFDDKTMNYYKTLRQCHLDPVLNVDVEEDIAFKFKYQWDPYTGERLNIDPFGALYFHPITLIYHFYNHRLDGLWKDAIDSQDGYFQGYYDMFVGAGDELEVIGRGKFTELYIFRLPIPDCYLTANHNKSFITMGPRINDDEIDALEKFSQSDSVKKLYLEYFSKNCPSIKKLKYFYDNAISKNPIIPENMKKTDFLKKYPMPQHYFVDQLRQM